MKDRLTITEIAKSLGITPRTIMRWEKAGKIKKSKRDWRGWRFYHKDDLDSIKKFYESAYEYEELDKNMFDSAKDIISGLILIFAISSFVLCPMVNAIGKDAVTENAQAIEINLNNLPAVNAPTQPSLTESVKYTLGPDDVIKVEVRRHPEFSGEYPINSEGKIQYKYLGDVIVAGMTKDEVKERLTQILSEYVIKPEIDVQISAYLSKVFYVVGEVGRPGKFFMRGDTITVREALVQAGLPTYAAAMRRCRIITPNQTGKDNYGEVNVYALLYEGDLRENKIMQPGEVLYIPATVIAKIIRVISPVTDAVSSTSGAVAPVAAAAAL